MSNYPKRAKTDKEGQIEGIFFRNGGQIEGIYKENREQNPFVMSSISRVQLFQNTEYQVSFPDTF